MRQILDAIKTLLEDDPVLGALVGYDEFGQRKIYISAANSGVEPMFLVIQTVPGVQPQGTYADPYAIENLEFSVTSWGETGTDAWQLAETADDAFLSNTLDPDLTPRQLMILRRSAFPQELPDRDTSWRQVVALYRMSAGR
jgi:hypothetical protein